jgi:RNA recognition motif-containing protein
VGNLSWETSWQDLKDHFRQVGEVMHADVMQSADGRSKGCGLVTFANAHDAARAIQQLHDSVLHSRSIFVREDREAALPGLPAPGGRGGGAALAAVAPSSPRGPSAAIAAEPGTKVFVGNLSFETSWQDLKDHFRQVGEVMHADVMQSADGRSKGCGMVTFSTAREAAHAISTLNQTTIGGAARHPHDRGRGFPPSLRTRAPRQALPAARVAVSS